MKKILLFLMMTSYIFGEDLGYRLYCKYYDANLCKYIGIMFEKGILLKQNPKKANLFFKYSCKSGQNGVCRDTAYKFYLNRNYTKAIEIYKIACDNGDIFSCHNLGGVYYNHTKEHQKALESFEIACRNDYYNSCYALGRMYYKGEGTKRNIGKGAKLFLDACLHDNASACLALGGMIEGNLTRLSNNKSHEYLYQKACDLGNKDACKKLKY